jgi:hypothetical protein
MKYSLFLDDIRTPEQVTWIRLPQRTYKIVRNYREFVEYIEQHGMPEFVSFDHDLSDEHYDPRWTATDTTEKTGLDCAKWLIEYSRQNKQKFPDYRVHSMNPVGRQRIHQTIEAACQDQP